MAFEFICQLSIEELAIAINRAGPWTWQLRESHWYGDYLNCRPESRVRMRIHQPRHFIFDGAAAGEPPDRYLAQLNGAGAALESSFLELLRAVGARDVTRIESYD
jgi:hypothetical protein